MPENPPLRLLVIATSIEGILINRVSARPRFVGSWEKGKIAKLEARGQLSSDFVEIWCVNYRLLQRHGIRSVFVQM